MRVIEVHWHRKSSWYASLPSLLPPYHPFHFKAWSAKHFSLRHLAEQVPDTTPGIRIPELAQATDCHASLQPQLRKFSQCQIKHTASCPTHYRYWRWFPSALPYPSISSPLNFLFFRLSKNTFVSWPLSLLSSELTSAPPILFFHKVLCLNVLFHLRL